MTRRPMNLLAIAWITVMAGLCAVMVTACSHSKRTDTIKAGLISVNSAREAFAVWDLHHQKKLVDAADSRESAEKAVAEYRARRQRIVETFETAYRGLANAALDDNDSSMSIAMKLVGILLDTIETFTEGGQ